MTSTSIMSLPSALIVEPNDTLRAMLGRMVEKAGFHVVLVAAGGDALRLARTSEPDVIVLSYRLPDMGCFELAEALRPLVAVSTPFLLVTSEDERGFMHEAFSAGFTDVFQRGRLSQLGSYLLNLSSHGQCHELQHARVLLVEDSKVFVHVITGLLNQCDMRVDSVSSVQEAKQLYAQHDYQLVITDLALEGDESGLALVRNLRLGEQDYARLPILVVTGFDDPLRKAELFRAGVNDYVTKPINEVEFMARVRNLMIARSLYARVAAQEERMRELATTDQLTGLSNRHFYTEMAARYIARSEREAEPLGMLIMDVDFFKLINDRHGHAGGDEVLRSIGELLRERSRRGDVAARFGGEEFIVLLPKCGAGDALAKAEGLRKAAEQRDVGGIRFTISLGVACFDPARPEPMASLFARADAALYEAKRKGRNQVVMASPVSPPSQEADEERPVTQGGEHVA